MIWHVVSNEVGEILAVYGEALLSEAQALAGSVENRTACRTYLHSVECGTRPRVGQSISMKGVAK